MFLTKYMLHFLLYPQVDVFHFWQQESMSKEFDVLEEGIDLKVARSEEGRGVFVYYVLDFCRSACWCVVLLQN